MMSLFATKSRTVVIYSLVFAATLMLSVATSCAEEPAAKKLTLTELRAQRKEMTQRKRRIIFNNDGDDIGGLAAIGTENQRAWKIAATPEGLLSIRTTPLLGSQVDSIFYHSALGMKLHHGDGPYGEIYGAPDPSGFYLRNRINLLANYGKDSLDVMIDHCRKNGLEIFYSNRMNDGHDYYFPGTLYYLRVKHPEYTIGHSGRSPEETLKLLLQTQKVATGYNFALPVIRDLTVEAMREVCRNYDIDGIELDYFRGPHLFPMPVDAKEIELLNDMMRKMRKMTEEEGLRRGRPILIAARYMVNMERSLYYGLDVKTWLEEGLVDILTGASSQRHPVKSLFDLAHRYGVTCYPMVNCSSKDGNQSGKKRDWNVWRADAMSCFVQGADGITTFNSFDPTEPLWWELGDPEKMLSMDKTYVWDYLPSAGYARNKSPVTVSEEGSESIPLYIGDDFSAAAPKGKTRKLKLRIHQMWIENKPATLTDPTPKHDLTVKLNGKPLQVVKALLDVEDQRKTASAIPFSQEWQFKTDPEDKGLSNKWFANDFDDSSWAAVRSDKGNGWDGYGFAGYTGYGWYRSQLPPLSGPGRKHNYIYFGAVDEQAWVYLNGELIAEHTTRSTGLIINDLWTKPFGVDISDRLRTDAPNVLTVRVHNAQSMGGIWKPVYLVSSDIAIDDRRQGGAVRQLIPGPQSAWLEFTPDAKLFKLGENLVEAQVKKPPTQTIKIDQVRLELRYVD